MFLVLTLGLIGTWQVFDQIYVMSQGNPAKTTLTPAFLSYRTAFSDFNYGSGAAISFILFLIIVVLTLFQRWVMRDRDSRRVGARDRGRRLRQGRHAVTPSSGPRYEQVQAAIPRRRDGGGRPPSRTRRRVRVTAGGSPPGSSATRVLVFFALVFLYPFVIQLANSFKTEPDAAANPLSPVPHPFSDDELRADLRRHRLPAVAGNSVLVTVLVTVGRVFFDSLAGYALARLRFRGRRGDLRHRARGDGRARRGAADPEVPGAQATRPLRQLRRR